MMQCATRCARTPAEAAPRIRVLRVAPCGVDDCTAASALVERAVSESTYEGRLAGPKGRKRMGVIQSADWGELLAPFGVVRKVDAYDNRVLIDASKEATPASPA